MDAAQLQSAKQCPPRRTPRPALRLVFIGLAVYAANLTGPFVFDDNLAIVLNPDVRSFAAALWPSPNAPLAGRPMVALSLAANYAIGELNPIGYRLVNIALHIIAALLLLAVVRRHGEMLGFTAALLWLVHPINSEVVNYITQRTESMMAVCFLMTLYASIRALETGRRRWCAAGVAACALGMLCKESMVTCPVIVALYGWVFHRDALRANRALLIGLASTWLVLAGVMLSSPRGDSVGADLGVTPWQYLLNQAVMIGGYLKRIVWPTPLLLDHGIPEVLSMARVWPYGLLIVVMVMGAVLAFRRRPKVGLLCVAFFILLAPTSSFVPIITEVGAERRMYLPMMVIAVLAALACRNWRSAPVAIALVLAVVTVQRSLTWRDPVRLWSQCVVAQPDNIRARNNLAFELTNRGRIDEALVQLYAAREIDPTQDSVRENIAKLEAFVQLAAVRE